QPQERLEDGHGVADGQFDFVDLACEAVGFDDFDGALADEAATVDGGDDAVFAVEASDEGAHGLGEGYPVVPLLQLVGAVAAHSFPFSPIAPLRCWCGVFFGYIRLRWAGGLFGGRD